MSIYHLPLERILGGTAQALVADVLPQVEDHYARAQLRAAAELLRNLEGRVAWAPEPIERLEASDAAALAELGEPTAPADGTPLERLTASRARFGAAIDDAFADGSADQATLDAIWAAIGQDFAVEQDVIRTGALNDGSRTS